MNVQTSKALERMCDVLELQRAEISGKLLTGYLPDGAAVEFAASALSLGITRRVVVAPIEDNTPTHALESFIRRLNRDETTIQWEIRRRDRPRGIEAWLITMIDRDECDDETETIRKASAQLGKLAEKHHRTVQVLCQHRVATILQRYLSDSTPTENESC